MKQTSERLGVIISGLNCCPNNGGIMVLVEPRDKNIACEGRRNQIVPIEMALLAKPYLLSIQIIFQLPVTV